MILTVTLNPAVDRTLWIDRLVPGALHRLKASRSDAAGKGINVSRALFGWGAATEIITVVGGATGEWIRQTLAASGLRGFYIAVAGESRVNTKVVEESGRLTEFNELGPAVPEEVLDAAAEAVAKRIGEASWLVLSGSLPRGLGPEAYRTLIGAARRLRPDLPVALDASGEALALGIKAGPDLIKPNREEMAQLVGRPLTRLDDCIEAVAEVRRRGVSRVVLSLGAEGALFGGPEGLVYAKSRPVKVKSPTGCGDTLLAAALYGLLQGWSWERCARFAVSAATAAAMLEGTTFPTLEQVREAEEGVEAEAI